jgi:hypothetical protein
LSEYGAIVFYDSSYKSRLLGKRLDKEFEWVFGIGTLFFVPIVSSDYVDRHWPQFEWSIARSEAQNRGYEFILPLRFDDAKLLGLPDTIGYLDLREHGVEETATILMDKLQNIRGIVAYVSYEQTWIATLGLLIEDVVDSDLVPSRLKGNFPELCDWLEDDLLQRLRKSEISKPRFVEPSQRTGETLSVRVSFEWAPPETALSLGDLDWWDLLEIYPLEEKNI